MVNMKLLIEVVVFMFMLLLNINYAAQSLDDLSKEGNILLQVDANSTKLTEITGRGSFKFEDDYQHFDPDDGPFIGDGPADRPPLRFEDSPKEEVPGRVTFQDDNRLEEDDYSSDPGVREPPTRIIFQDDNKTPPYQGTKKKRRRRRKPRYQIPPSQYTGPLNQYPGSQNQYPSPQSQYPGSQNQYPSPQSQYPGPQNQYPGPPLPSDYPGYPGQPYPEAGQGFGPGGRLYYRPPRRPKQSFAASALSKVAGALSSIAQYDDYQCVPRLLCEAAGGGALGASSVLQSVAGLQPLLTLLSAYNGVSSSPLFIFGRAVILGMTSKGNTASCRYAYSQCPTDPEELVHYLNNHNGGFFRFFNSPQQHHPQNVEQFYHQLSGQYGYDQNGYGLFDPPENRPQLPNSQYNPYPPHNPGSPNPNQQYGYYQPYPPNSPPQYPQYPLPQYPGPNPGYYPPNPYPSYAQPYYPNPPHPQYGLYNQYPGPPNTDYYANKYNYKKNPKYGPKYPYAGKYGYTVVKFKDNSEKEVKIEKRIQNKPSYLYIDSNVGDVDVNSKWIFPEIKANNEDIITSINNIRGGKGLKFPEGNGQPSYINKNGIRQEKTVLFPDYQNTKYINYYEYPPVSNSDNSNLNYGNQKLENVYLSNFDYNKNYNNYHQVNNNKGYSQKYGYNSGQSNNVLNNNGYGTYGLVNSNRYSKYMYNNEEEDGLQTVYVVRGNGDPNHPEIIKVRPGENIML